MKGLLEKVSLLALSSMLISTYSISPALPYLLDFYGNRPAEQVELLISIPSFMIMAVLLSNSLLNRYLKERQIILAGLVILGLSGMVPMLVQDYTVVLISRLFLGLGVGLINAKAISIISERFEGRERVQMQGYRGSAEVVGSSFLTVLVGFLIPIDWQLAFAIYSFAFLVLLLYLVFVPKMAEQTAGDQLEHRGNERLTSRQRVQALFYALLAGMGVFVNTVVSMRTPIMVTEMGLGTASQASYILSLQQLIGIVSGILFGILLGKLGRRLGGLAYLGLGLTYLLMGLAQSLFLLGAGTILSGFFYSLVMTVIFYSISDIMPAGLINAATAIVLLGCNLGSASSPYLLKGLGLFLASNSQIFLFLAGLMFFIGGGLLVRKRA